MPRENGSKASSDVRYVPCRVEPGMFRGEWLVFLDVINPQNPEQTLRVQLLVDQREVSELRGDPKRNQPAEGWLRVALAGKAKGFAQLVLPQPATPVGESILLDEKLVKSQPGP
jgi:hypothetical protein